MKDITLEVALNRLDRIDELSKLGHDDLFKKAENHPWNNGTDNHNFVHGKKCGLEIAGAIARGETRGY